MTKPSFNKYSCCKPKRELNQDHTTQGTDPSSRGATSVASRDTLPSRVARLLVACELCSYAIQSSNSSLVWRHTSKLNQKFKLITILNTLIKGYTSTTTSNYSKSNNNESEKKINPTTTTIRRQTNQHDLTR